MRQHLKSTFGSAYTSVVLVRTKQLEFGQHIVRLTLKSSLCLWW